MIRIARRPVRPRVRRGLNGENEQPAHRTLSPGWTPVRVLARAGRPVMRFEYRRPHTFRVPPPAGHSTRGKPAQSHMLDACGLRSVRGQT